jgi:hypothetical protein
VDEESWFCQIIIDWEDTKVRVDGKDLTMRVVMVTLAIAGLGLSRGCEARVSHHMWKRD